MILTTYKITGTAFEDIRAGLPIAQRRKSIETFEGAREHCVDFFRANNPGFTVDIVEVYSTREVK